MLVDALLKVPAPCDAVPDKLTEVTSPRAVESSDTTPVIVIVKSLAGDCPESWVPGITNVWFAP